MFYMVFIFIIVQRVTELFIARKNEKWMRNRGGIEHGKDHYPYIVSLHILFLVSFFIEVQVFRRELTEIWFVMFPILFLTQLLRYWAVFSLGNYWNTKIMIVPGDVVISRGPYKFVKHPNYIVVAIEILILPLLFHAYITAILFTILNVIMMTIRIPAEESALQTYTNYHEVFSIRSIFTSKKK
ncbi:isoprenylcysteine carboxyl methyltransferase family protein [Metabacillus niabensis]|uniref:isoprenylcysteine carboxyl methyltransferase family protein n=1 Tax=Metabacillus niabensis TaxID=324854 RepID=UPI001CF97944|nr:isoprenylcysteine carboxylmethyltransferase family protein [Metabacillus niabensis]